MELQLEEEYEERQKVTKEKRELESRLLSAEDRVRLSSMAAAAAALAWSPAESRTCLHR